MHRDYTATGILEIPKLEARAALALGKQLLAAVSPHKKTLSKNVAKGLAAMRTSVLALALVLRDQVGPTADGKATRKGDQKIDGAWGGLGDFLNGLAKLDGEPAAAEAAELRAEIFPNGMGFLTLPYLLEWTESEMRLERIARDGLEPRLVAIGGEIFLRALRRAHEDYGAVLGVTAPLVEGPETPSIREALDAFESALRVYVVRVAAWCDPDEPGTEEASAAMLLPLRSFRLGGRPARGGDGDEDVSEDEVIEDVGGPAPPPAPASPPAQSPAPGATPV